MSHAFGWIAAALIVAAPVPEATPMPMRPVSGETPVALPGPVADLRPMEVRIRKLYLVRPDLLQFPNPYDVVC